MKTILLVVAILAMAPFFFVGGPSPIDPPTTSALLNLAHLVFFAAAAMLAWSAIPPLRRLGTGRALLVLLLTTLLLGLGIEVVQGRFARDPDWHDVWRNQLGVALAWFLVIRPPQRARSWILGLLAVLVLVEVGLVVRAYVVEWRVQHRLPVIADFETDGPADHWSDNTRRTRDLAWHGDHSLRIDLDTSTYSGTFARRFPRDWSGWRYLAFAIHNPDPDTLRLTVKVADREHYETGYEYENRFNRSIWAPPGWSEHRIPLAEVAAAPAQRRMDLREIVTFGMFATRLPAPRVIYLDHVRLE
jgi:hypothetical protein